MIRLQLIDPLLYLEVATHRNRVFAVELWVTNDKPLSQRNGGTMLGYKFEKSIAALSTKEPGAGYQI